MVEFFTYRTKDCNLILLLKGNEYDYQAMCQKEYFYLISDRLELLANYDKCFLFEESFTKFKSIAYNKYLALLLIFMYT
jgi:hypothetical protein